MDSTFRTTGSRQKVRYEARITIFPVYEKYSFNRLLFLKGEGHLFLSFLSPNKKISVSELLILSLSIFLVFLPIEICQCCSRNRSNRKLRLITLPIIQERARM